MSEPEKSPPGSDLPELDETGAEPEKSPFVLVAQFFVIPLVVVVLAVSIFLVFGLATSEKHSPSEYLQEVRTGSLNRRWQAAFALSSELARKPELGGDEALFRDTLQTFEKMRGEAEVRRYLALALGRFRRAEAVPALIEALADEDEETRLYAILALGSIKDRAAVAPLRALLRAEEPALRKGAAFALGGIGDPAAIEELKTTADDTRFDVALQGALALAQLGDRSGVAVLRRALDPVVVAQAVKMEPAQQAEATVNALRGLVLLHDRDSLPQVEALAKSHPTLAVRNAALEAREQLVR
jgi:HEAT repeat protein